MSFTKRLYERAQPIWRKSVAHPFVQGIGHGNLDLEKFKFYMCQDYVYLIDYSRLFALGSLKAHDLKTMGTFAKLLDATINMEMDLHRAYAKRLGITEEELESTQASPITLAYTGYMLNISQRGSLPELIAAVLPCAWHYHETGLELAKIPGSTEHEVYGHWVNMYRSAEFGELGEWLINLMDEFAAGRNEQELARWEDIFLNTSRYEYMFWDMAWNMTMWPTDE